MGKVILGSKGSDTRILMTNPTNDEQVTFKVKDLTKVPKQQFVLKAKLKGSKWKQKAKLKQRVAKQVQLIPERLNLN